MPAHASLSKRLVAGVLDAAVVVVGTLAVGLSYGDTQLILGNSDAPTFATSREITAAYYGLFWNTIWVAAVYGTLLETTLGATVGKLAMGIRPVDEAGQPVTKGRAMMRNVARLVSFYVFGLGFIWAAVDKKHRTWHDLMVGTYVAIDDR